jgi:hypothetical protein
MGTFSSAPSHANALPQQGGLCLLAASFAKFNWPGQDCAMDLIAIDSRAQRAPLSQLDSLFDIQIRRPALAIS